MHWRYALMAGLSLLLLQTSPGDRGNASLAELNSFEPPAPLPAKKIIAHGVNLGPDAETISAEALPVLIEAAELLGSHGPVVITVDPPADDHHDDAYRQLLRRRRAKAIRRRLMEDGISPDRIAFPADAGAAIAAADAPPRSRPMELHVP